MTQGSGPDVGKCHSCGAALTPEDYRAAACRFCGAAHVHHRRAAEKVAQVQALLRDANGNGIPDALEGVMGGVQPVSPLQGIPQPFAPPPGGYPNAQGPIVWQHSTVVVHHQVQQATKSAMSTIVVMLAISFLLLLLGIGVGIFFFLHTS